MDLPFQTQQKTASWREFTAQAHQSLVAAVQTEAKRLGIDPMWALRLAHRYRLSEGLAVRFCHLAGWLNDLQRVVSGRQLAAAQEISALVNSLQAELQTRYQDLVRLVQSKLPEQLLTDKDPQAAETMRLIEKEAAWLQDLNCLELPPGVWRTPDLLLTEAQNLWQQFPIINDWYQQWMHRADNGGLPGPDPLAHLTPGLMPPPITYGLLLNDARKITEAYWTTPQNLGSLPDFSGVLELLRQPESRTFFSRWATVDELKELEFKWTCLVSIRKFLVRLQELNFLYPNTQQRQARFAEVRSQLYQTLMNAVNSTAQSFSAKQAEYEQDPQTFQRSLMYGQAAALTRAMLRQIPEPLP